MGFKIKSLVGARYDVDVVIHHPAGLQIPLTVTYRFTPDSELRRKRKDADEATLDSRGQPPYLHDTDIYDKVVSGVKGLENDDGEPLDAEAGAAALREDLQMVSSLTVAYFTRNRELAQKNA